MGITFGTFAGIAFLVLIAALMKQARGINGHNKWGIVSALSG